jgi:hypothetical protein
MQQACINMLKEGVVWDDVHLQAHEIAIIKRQQSGDSQESNQRGILSSWPWPLPWHGYT